MFKTFHESVAPGIKKNPRLASKVQVIFRQQIQPWHPSSTLTHEAGLAVQRLAPTRFYDFSRALFQDQKSYFDVNVVNETRNNTYRRLAKLAASSAGVKEDQVYEMLAVPDKPSESGELNVGNQVTNDLKVITKMARLVGVHVTPTVIFDGVVNNDISSSWTGDQWLQWLEKSVA
jgi:protein-disulfide isomerase